MALSIDLSGKKALVSGVTSGIGAAIAQVMAEAGCDVAGCGLEANAPAFVASVEQHGRNAYYAQTDLRLPDAPYEWVRAASGALGGIDIVISNAGRNVFTGAADSTESDWDEAINLDLASHWRVAKAAYPYLQHSDEPVIIVITSNHANHTIPGCFPYNVAKAGLVAMVQSLAIEWGPIVRAIGIAPGFIDTPGNDVWFNTFADPQAERERTEQLHPVGRIGTPEEIGGLCAFLCSPYSRFISGTTLLVDGGRSALMQDQ